MGVQLPLILVRFQRNSGESSGPGPLSFWVIFLMARTIPPSFVEIAPKLRVVAPLMWEWPKTAKNRGKPQKMTPSSETEIFWGWFRWESCSLGYSGHLLHQQKLRSLNKKLTFGPKYPNFGVKKAHFRPLRPIGASTVNVFNTKKVSHWNPDTRVPKFLLPAPQNLDFGPKNGQIWPKTGILGQISAFLAHLI